MPEDIVVGSNRQMLSNGEVQNVPLKAQFMSMRNTLKCFLESGSVFYTCLEVLNNSKSNNSSKHISNLLEANLWKVKSKNSSNYEFPIFIYYDDFEIENALGSHAGIHKLRGIYYTIPVIPLEFHSQLKNIFVAMQFGSKVLFSKLVDELIYLETVGIIINVSDTNFNIKFKLTLIQGDNLGLHTILGFVESFNSCYCCRFYKMNRENC